MNDSDSKIDRMLRESPPEPQPRPGLETRICSTLRHSPKPARSPLLPAIIGIAVAAPMFILGIFALLPSAPDQPGKTAKVDPPPVKVEEAEPTLTERNPLRGEALAIRNDASRASRFLLDALPSLAER